MKILIADDHALFLDGLRMQVEQLYPDSELHQARDHKQAVRFVKKNPDTDYVILDLTMPGMPWEQAVESILEHINNGRIIVMSGSEDVVDVRKALDYGVAGFIPKRSDTHILVNALRLVLDGGTYLPPILLETSDTRSPIKNMPASRVGREASRKEKASLQSVPPGCNVKLTKRQTEVLAFLGKGLSNKIIAHEMGVSEATVKLHINALLRNLNVSNRTQAVVEAQNIGLL